MPAADSPSTARRLAWGAFLWVLFAGAMYAAFAAIHYHWNWAGFEKNIGQFMSGWGRTVVICMGALVLCIAGGFGLMLAMRSTVLPLQMAARGYVMLVRSTPLLVQLLIGYYVIANALQIRDAILVGIVLLGCFEAAYLAEIFRGALDSIGRSQWEAARAVGFDTAQAYRYVLIPQAIRRALPGATGELVSLVKNSSLLSVIGIEEVTQVTRLINSGNYTALEGFIPLALAYLAMTVPLTWIAQRWEARFAYET